MSGRSRRGIYDQTHLRARRHRFIAVWQLLYTRCVGQLVDCVCGFVRSTGCILFRTHTYTHTHTGGIGKNQKDAKGLKVYLDGADDGKPSRFSTFAGAIERAIAGPYFFGEEPSYVDFLASTYNTATRRVLVLIPHRLVVWCVRVCIRPCNEPCCIWLS